MATIECYNCPKMLTKKESTKEHIPAKCMFYGYDETYKTNRITVPSCRDCNEKFALIDIVLKQMVGVSNESNIEQNELTKSAVKSILSSSDSDSKLIIQNDKVIAVKFDYEEVASLHKKNFKGIFYHSYKRRIGNNYQIEVTTDIINDWKYVYDFVDENQDWEFSGHKDIFKFKFCLLKTQKQKIILSDDPSEADIIASIMVYHQMFTTMVVAIP